MIGRNKSNCIWRDKLKGFPDSIIIASEIYINGKKVSIHRHIYFEKDDWLLDGFGFMQRLLSSKDLNLAKQEAINLIEVKVERTVKDINTINNWYLPKGE